MTNSGQACGGSLHALSLSKLATLFLLTADLRPLGQHAGLGVATQSLSTWHALYFARRSSSSWDVAASSWGPSVSSVGAAQAATEREPTTVSASIEKTVLSDM